MKATSQYEFIHSHTIPVRGKVGLPVFNRFTGHNEGPFSKYFSLPESTKIVIIYRDPAKAYKSRCSLKHYCHIWSETEKFEKELGPGFDIDNKESRKKFNDLWNDKKSVNQDVLDLMRFMQIWQEFANESPYEIAFVEYESLHQCSAEICEFLGIKNLDFSGFKISDRSVDETLLKVFPITSPFSNLAPFKSFPAKINLPSDYAVLNLQVKAIIFVCDSSVHLRLQELMELFSMIINVRFFVQEIGSFTQELQEAVSVVDFVYSLLLSPHNFSEVETVCLNELGDDINLAQAYLSNYVRWLGYK
ncbi:hypothetical protein DXV75_06130 [Alteromonas aestuariivivens]|uniref:Sulfotransferase domain-containing protein n=2 Tax=Alteromonas aestuariivivens TaxID=1938339 RepID=A0A3D8M9S7_9ALTE|nr:hypothetical protein DXV75_06130 [Alteromonas aestuariivivens]